MQAFVYPIPTRVIFGKGVKSQTAEQAIETTVNFFHSPGTPTCLSEPGSFLPLDREKASELYRLANR